MTPRQQKRVERLEELKTTTLSLVVEQGFDAFSMHKLADRVGLTTGALYRYYDSRDELLVEVQCDILDGFMAFFDERLSNHGHDSELAKLSCLMNGFLDLAEDRPEHFQLIAHFSSQPQTIFDVEVVAPLFEKMKTLLEFVADHIDAAQRSKSLDQGHAMRRAVFAWSALQAVTERKKYERFEGDAFEYAPLKTEAVETLLRGWGATKMEDVCLIS